MAHFGDNSENGNNHDSQIDIKKKNIRVFVADDHKLMLDAIVKLIAPHCEVVGTAADGRSAQEMIEQLKPDIAVLDITMPFKTGIEIASDLKASGSEVKIVIITADDNESNRQAALSAGASAFVVKTRLASELTPALKNASAGKSIQFSER